MAKLGKIKLTHLGDEKARTTFQGPIELYLYYDSMGDYFYFDDKELKTKLPDIKTGYGVFHKCRTKNQAVSLVSALLKQVSEPHKMIKIQIQVCGGLPKINTLSTHAREIFQRFYHEDRAFNPSLELSFNKVIRYKVNGEFIYCDVKDDWSHPKDPYLHFMADGIFDWDQETGDFLETMRVRLNKLNNNIVEFFNTKTVDELKQRIKNNPLLIEAK